MSDAAAVERIRVWAPRATAVDLVTPQGRARMQAVTDGYHEIALPELPERYMFSVDGGEPRPDPASRWQPDGVNSWSHSLDPAALTWPDIENDWRGFAFADAVLYEIHTGTFSATGDYSGVVQHLDAIEALGANAIELMPLATFPGHHGWGYDGVGLYAPHPAYGSAADLAALIAAAHARGIAVVVDVVYNHLGPDGNHLAEFGPYFTDHHTTPWGDAVNMDSDGSRHVRNFFIDNALMWLRDYHVDGLRLDATHAIVDDSQVHFLSELSARVSELADQTGRTIWLVAESEKNDPAITARRDDGGNGLDGQWDDDLHHVLHAFFTGERDGYYGDYGDAADIVTVLNDFFVLRGDVSRVTGKQRGASTDGVESTRMVSCLQNHDQIGNRCQGERFGVLTEPAVQRVAAAITLLSPFVPLIFQGEEWAATSPFLYFTDHQDPALGDAVREGRKKEFEAFGWAPDNIPDPQSGETFTRSKLRWDERDTQAGAAMFGWYKRLLEVRRQYPFVVTAPAANARLHDDALLIVDRGATVLVCSLTPEGHDLDAVGGIAGGIDLLGTLPAGSRSLPALGAALILRD